MERRIENTNPKILILLLRKMYLGLNSMITDYKELYTEAEITLLSHIQTLIQDQLNKIKKNDYNIEMVRTILNFEVVLKPLAFRTWEQETYQGAECISWLKSDYIMDKKPIISATFSKQREYTFCQSNYGIKYHISLDGFLGSNNQDAATLIENNKKHSIYTIGKTKNGKIINSYNLATPLSTPKQAKDQSSNQNRLDYKEIILDRRHVVAVSVVYQENSNMEFVRRISESYHVPLELKRPNSKVKIKGRK